jgi:membrane-bound lytic murein transglycosylase MltF
MKPLHALCTALVLLAGGVAAAAQDSAGSAMSNSALTVPAVIREAFTGDLPQIRERGILRALVSPNRTDFFLQGAQPRGLLVEALEQYRVTLNKGRTRREMQIAIKYVIVPFDELIPALLEGRGDIAVAHLTITPEREAKVAFVRGKENRVNELLVTHKGVTDISSLDDLSGRNMEVVAGSSYAQHLRGLSKRLIAEGKAPIEVKEANRHLATEDLLEMVNAGVIELTVADDYRARLWAKVLPDIVVREDVKVNVGGTLGWAVRKENPELLNSLEAVAPSLRAGTMIGNTLIKRYYGNTRWIKNPVSDAERAKLDRLMVLFRKYGEKYGFDWLALAAQGYQESALDQAAKSRAGALGIMQLLPSTASDPSVGIPDVSSEENNIHAGAKYMALLRDRYYNDPLLSKEDRVAFCWAAYNAGPGNVRRMRRMTKELGLDPNRWFGNVEHAALAIIGQETVQYVRNIYKYYLTYQSLREQADAQKEARQRAGAKRD